MGGVSSKRNPALNETAESSVNCLEGKDFTGLVLCDERSERLELHVRASMLGGALGLSCQDIGPVVEECWGDDDYEYWYDFTVAETYKLLKAIDGLEDPKEALMKNFSGERGCAVMREVCEKEGIQFSFHSYV